MKKGQANGKYRHDKYSNGTYVFKHDGDKLYTTDRISILYGKNDDNSCVMIKHCTPANIRMHYEIKKETLKKTDNWKHLADNLHVLDLPKDISLEDLYKILHVPGCLASYVKNNES